MTTPDPIAGLGPRATKPSPNAQAALREANLTPTEGFVLSRVDGHTSYADLCNLTGLGAATTIDILRRLLAADLIRNPPGVDVPPMPVAVSPPPPSAAPASAIASPAPPPPKRPAADAGFLARLDDLSPVDPADLADGVDLDPLLKQRLIRVARRLPSLAPHELLGVAADADAKSVKKAYFLASKELHPDRFYGKTLGMYRPLLERLFRAASEAFEALEKKRV